MSREDKIAFIVSSNLFYLGEELRKRSDDDLDHIIRQIIKLLESTEKGVGTEVQRSFLYFLN